MRNVDAILFLAIPISLFWGLKLRKKSQEPVTPEIPQTSNPEPGPSTELPTLSQDEARVIQYQPLISQFSLYYDTEPAVIASIIMVESHGIEKALRHEDNGSTAYGLMQMTDWTARGLGFTGNFQELYNPGLNISLGCKLIKEGLDRYHNVGDAISYYNMGAVKFVNGTWKNASYVNKVLSYVNRFRLIWRSIYPNYDILFTVHSEVSPYGFFR